MAQAPFRAVKGGVALSVRLTPKSSRDAVDGVKCDSAGIAHLAARVRAVPDKGAANAALEKLIASWIGVASGAVAVTAGHTARLKTVTVSGDPAALEKLIAAKLA